MGKKLTTEEFINKAKLVHGNKYDYSKVKYVNSVTKVCIICPEHGEFWMKPNDHLCRKYGCHKCGWINEGINLRKKTQDFINEAIKKYGNKFDYSKVNYVRNNEKVCIISHEKDIYGIEIGEFWQTPSNHLRFGYCKKNIVLDTDRFIKRAKKIHADLYGYNKTEFKSSKEKVIITCPIHGDFFQLPHTHLNGSGCPKCKSVSVLEKRLRIILRELNVDFTEQQRFDFLGKLSLDFYLPNYKIAIECQGKQHFIDLKFWENFDTIIERDKRKKELCSKNGISILYVINKNYDKSNIDIYNENNTCNIKNVKDYIKKIINNE